MYELIIGQFLRLHSTAAWAFIKPRWQGLAISQFVMIVICQSYFVMVIGYTVVYMFGSCWDPLPWTVHNEGSEGYWYEDVLGLKETVEEAIETASLNDTSSNVTAIGNSNGYLFQDVDGLSLQWPLVGSLFFVYVVIFFATSFGKSVLADVTYVTVMAPVCLLWVLIIRTLFLPGAFDGLSFYLGKFELAKLGEAQVWANALSQSLFSMSPGFGTAITLSSIGGKHDDVYKAALVTSISNAAFAVCSGFAIFAMIGNIAYNTGQVSAVTCVDNNTRGATFFNTDLFEFSYLGPRTNLSLPSPPNTHTHTLSLFVSLFSFAYYQRKLKLLRRPVGKD